MILKYIFFFSIYILYKYELSSDSEGVVPLVGYDVVAKHIL